VCLASRGGATPALHKTHLHKGIMNWFPVQTYCVWGFDDRSGWAHSRGISTDSKGRVFACYVRPHKSKIPSTNFVVVCCDHGIISIVPIPLQIKRPVSAVISPDGDWLYVLTKDNGILRLSARETGKWGKPQSVVQDEEGKCNGFSDYDDSDECDDKYEYGHGHSHGDYDCVDTRRDLSMQCTGDSIWYWNDKHHFMKMSLPSGELRVMHKAPYESDIRFKWWVLDEHKMTYKMRTNNYPIEVDLVTGDSSQGAMPFDGRDVCPITCVMKHTWLGIAQPDAIDYENALVAFKDGDKDITYLIGGSDLNHKTIHDAFVRGEPSSVGNVRHAAVDSEGQLWVMDMRRYDTIDWNENHWDDYVRNIALRCVRCWLLNNFNTLFTWGCAPTRRNTKAHDLLNILTLYL